MFKQIFPARHQYYAQSPVASTLEAFAKWLTDEGYAGLALRRHLFRLKQVLERVDAVTPESIFSANELAALFTVSIETSPLAQKLYRYTQHRFERFLMARGCLVTESESGCFASLLGAYNDSLVEARGMAASTVKNHMHTATTFLQHAASTEASSLSGLSMQTVESFIAASAKEMSRQSLQHVVAHLRSLLSFCHAHGDIQNRIGPIDSPCTYRGELPPRALAWPHVLTLLRSIDRSSTVGCRDHAVLYLMANYGLRPSEIVSLKLESIDWIRETLLVKQSKSRSELLLPLSGQTIRVLKRYLRHGRPAIHKHTELFLRAHIPAVALQPTAINEIYKTRLRASGLALQDSSAYSLRHAFAMRLLNKGVGVKTIGDLLGHRSLESTCVYLRIQTDALREVGLPIPASATTNRIGRRS